jgi:hypothetical protein
VPSAGARRRARPSRAGDTGRYMEIHGDTWRYMEI